MVRNHASEAEGLGYRRKKVMNMKVKKKSLINWILDRVHPVIRSKKPASAAHLKAGRWGEKQAEIFLKKAGYKILGRRVRVGRHDEIDLIARCGDDMMVFAEVKTRRNENYGRPAASVNREKRRKLSRAAVTFLQKRKLRPPYIRFDVIEVIGEPDGEPPEIRQIKNAFQLEGGYRIWW